MITHIDRKLAQQIVNTVKDVCGQDINFIDTNGIVFASTDEKRIGTFHEIALKVASTGNTQEVLYNNIHAGSYEGVNLPVYHNGKIVAVIGISGPPDIARKYAYLAERITSLLIREQELNAYSRNEADKKNYIIQTLLYGENINYEYLLSTISNMNIDKTQDMRIILIRLNPRYNRANVSLLEQKIQNLFQTANTPLYTYHYPNEYIAVCEDRNFISNQSYFQEFANNYNEILRIGVGNVTSIFQLSGSYNAASIAINSMRPENNGYSNFEDLTLEMILGTLDKKTQDDYLRRTVSKLSEEDLKLLRIYYHSDMSLTNTCNQLYIHKNTLQYKLDRINRLCGLNPRKFQDAVVLYIATCLKE